MVIYCDLTNQSSTLDYIARIRFLIDQIKSNSYSDHNTVAELLIDFGDLQTALTDYYSSKEEVVNPLIKNLNQIGKIIGSILLKSWNEESNLLNSQTERKLNACLNYILSCQIPDTITVKVPEGYAYYGYFPETYLEAANKCFKLIKPKDVVVIGIRSIGSSFSNAVAALMESNGCKVELFTVRPKGEYSSRFLKLSKEMKSELLKKKGSLFLIVDEGPGLSGSSFGITAEVLSGLGIPDDQIIFISSWEPDGSGLISEIGKIRWKKHKKFSASFEETWLKNNRLVKSFPHKELLDISNGRWRSLFYFNEEEFPLTYPVEERKKFLCSKFPLQMKSGALHNTNKMLPHNNNIFMIKFAGLGRYGKALFERAKILSQASLIPSVVDLQNGFLIFNFIEGLPLRKENISFEFINSAAKYLSFLYNKFPASPSRNFEEMLNMIHENVCEYLGESWAKMIDNKKQLLASMYSNLAVAVDGHMFLHEWITSKERCFKTDAVTHHADQFFPGCQSILWDIVGFSIESNLDNRRESFFIKRFSELSGFREIGNSLNFYKLAYLSFRMGYSAVISDVMVNSPEGKKAKIQADRYADQLKTSILEQCS